MNTNETTETPGTAAERFMSLGQFSKDYGIAKGTLHRKAQELGLNTSNGLTKTAHDQLCKAFEVGSYEPIKPVEPETMKTVSMGNGELTIFDSSDLTPSTSTEFTGLDLGSSFKGLTTGTDLSNLKGLGTVLDQLTVHLENTAAKELQTTVANQLEAKALRQKLEKAKTAKLKAEITLGITSALNQNLNDEVAEITEGFMELGGIAKE